MRLESFILTLSAIGAYLISYLTGIVADNADMFMAIIASLGIDWVSGTYVAIKNKNFSTKQSLKIVRNLGIWLILLGALLAIQKGFSVPYLSQAVIVPLLLFQMVSTLKNLSLVGVIPAGLLKSILSSIDKHKDSV